MTHLFPLLLLLFFLPSAYTALLWPKRCHLQGPVQRSVHYTGVCYLEQKINFLLGCRERESPSLHSHGRGQLPWSIASPWQCELSRVFFWLKQHIYPALPFMLVFCVFKRTCICPHMLILALKWTSEPWNLCLHVHSPLHPGEEVRLQCASIDSRTAHNSKISSQKVGSSDELCCCEKSICILWPKMFIQAIEKASDPQVFRKIESTKGWLLHFC